MDKKRMPIYGIKGKLVSACCMLLVAVIMVVSSTYAWFTLSTAPEVKGISTSIGANGALEIKLDGATDNNGTPGNLVDLSDTSKYGMDKIVLNPSMLVLDEEGKIHQNFLAIPEYNEYGKVTTTTTNKTSAGSYTGSAFVTGATNGLRAVGVTSGLTDRQLAYRNAKNAASTNSGLAINKAASSLNTNGPVLGNIVIKKATVEAPTFTQAEINSLRAIVNDLGATDTGVLQYIKTAYEQMIVAYAASGAAERVLGDAIAAEAFYSTVKAQIGTTITLETIKNDGGITVAEQTIPLTGTDLFTGIEAFLTTKANVAAAQAALNTLAEKNLTNYTWDDIDDVLNYLIVINNVEVNEMSADEIKADMDGFANKVMSEGINIAMLPGAGVYVEIADQCGDYTAKVTMKNVTVKGIVFESLTANMATDSNKDPGYLSDAQDDLNTAGMPGGATAATKPMTDFYGYIIDLVFKTNAANSNLLLQTEATDRIYEDNTNELTQGGGSYMTFMSAASDFSNEQVKGLMESIRIVFFNPTTRDVFGYAMLDVEHASVGADGVTAKIYLYETVITYTHTYTPDDATEAVTDIYTIEETKNGDTTTYAYFKNGVDVTTAVTAVFTDAASKIPATFTKVTTYVALNGDKDAENAPVITALAQNQDVKVSALVYLDGESITNADVSAIGTASVTGKMNLQFSSSADLVPMEYGDLHIKDTPTTTAPSSNND